MKTSDDLRIWGPTRSPPVWSMIYTSRRIRIRLRLVNLSFKVTPAATSGGLTASFSAAPRAVINGQPADNQRTTNRVQHEPLSETRFEGAMTMTGRPQAARSRNGCITCKIRRVKCDEQKPECNRCVSTGRTCDGYQDGSQSPTHRSCSLRIIQHIPPGRKPPSAVPLTAAELRCLEFFHHYTLPSLGPEVGSYLLQATSSEPVIRSIALAVGSVHRSFAFFSDEDTTFTLTHYNKAIRQLVGTQQDRNLVLLACILFFCCECLQGRYRTAIQHALSGIRILQQQQVLSEASSEKAPPAVATLFHAVQNQVLEIEGMDGMDPESQPRLSPSAATLALLSQPLNITDHQRIFRQLYHRFMQIDALAEAFEMTPHDHSPARVAHEQQLLTEWFRVRADLKGWMQDFDHQIIHAWQTDPTTGSLRAKSTAILQAWKLLFDMYFRMDWPPSELAWDPFIPAYPLWSVPSTDHTGNMQGLRPSAALPSQPTFTLSLGFLTLLYICATRCRDSTIRRRALRLLETCRRREGVWDSDLAGRVARRLIEIEEHAAGLAPDAAYSPADISLDARVRSSSPQFGEGREARLRYIGGSCQSEVEPVEETILW
ncbi:Zn(II)2Cys6 transcription factor domain-containing protein [Aspergillus saccharolyticus JOP 1030-1]|uniref:Zn(2)-C6 fungal-type domain-containing protein n=1 Tax=Aspergillus saccharolyticus JOP 1030-1 TaxID=1450539 RepID=A0A318Z7G8_9EURO|nr:hypothetical protein BP01DRAFT_395650 [Aspergillus saccharolyticus JOP 1030-1]PYH40693.1 hypothetical protein BP01DRAFT_395650 [Aspergillus saccharolyticus JOP 1030-1]